MKKRSDVVMFSFVVYDFSSCVDDTLKLLVVGCGWQVNRPELIRHNQSLIG